MFGVVTGYATTKGGHLFSLKVVPVVNQTVGNPRVISRGFTSFEKENYEFVFPIGSTLKIFRNSYCAKLKTNKGLKPRSCPCDFL